MQQKTKQSFYKMQALLLVLLLAGCKTPTPKLGVDAHSNQLKNPQTAEQVPEKMADEKAREAVIYSLMQEANAAIAREDYEQAAQTYHTLLAYDPGNVRATEGLNRIETAKAQNDLVVQAESLMQVGDEASDEEAFALLKQVILSNPQHTKAAPLYNQLLAKQAEANRVKLAKKLVFNQPITMEFRDVNLKMIFESLAILL
jgi:general secretion pathway protein D